MPAFLTHWKILMETRNWLEENKEAMRTEKSELGDLAQKALDSLSSVGPYPDSGKGKDISKFAYFGSVGPDYVTMAALFAKDQDWAGEKALHDNQSGDHSTDFILKFIDKIASADKDKLMSYALGYMTHIAGDVLVHPYVNAFGEKIHMQVEVNQDSVAAKNYFGRDDIHSGESWTEYLFDDDDDRLDKIYKTFVSAFSQTFGTKPPSGISDDLEMCRDFLHDGYENAVDVVLDIVYDWSSWEFYWLPSLIFIAPIVGTYMLYWYSYREKKDWKEEWWINSLDAANSTAFISSFLFTLIIGLIFRYGIKNELIGFIVMTVLFICLMLLVLVLKKNFPKFKEFMSRWGVRLIILIVSLAFSTGSFVYQLKKGKNYVSVLSSGSSLGMFGLGWLNTWLLFLCRLAKDENKLTWLDWTLLAVTPWLWGFFTHIVNAIPEYPPTEPDAKFVGKLGNKGLVVEKNVKVQAPEINLEVMIEKTRVFAGILCLAAVQYSEASTDELKNKAKSLFKNWNLNKPGKAKWEEIIGTYDENAKKFKGGWLEEQDLIPEIAQLLGL